MTPFADVIEVNLGCPNKMPGEATLMESIGQKPELSGEVIRKIRQATKLPVIAKLSPNSDYLEVAAACIAGASPTVWDAATRLAPASPSTLRPEKPSLPEPLAASAAPPSSRSTSG